MRKRYYLLITAALSVAALYWALNTHLFDTSPPQSQGVCPALVVGIPDDCGNNQGEQKLSSSLTRQKDFVVVGSASILTVSLLGFGLLYVRDRHRAGSKRRR